jgi:hypothetical protein
MGFVTEIKAMFYGIKNVAQKMPLGKVILLDKKCCSYLKNVFLAAIGLY